MKNEFDKKLKKVVNQLPEYEANPDSWAAVEQYLVFSKKLNEVKSNLPVYSAPEDIWQRIETYGAKKTQSLSLLLWKVAVTVLFLAGTWFFYQAFSTRNLSYSTEVAEEINSHFLSESDSAVNEVTEFIEQQCQNQTYVCREPDFKVKKQKLEEINNEIVKLEEVMKTYGSSESLVKTRLKLENYKAEIIKDLIKKLTS